MTYIKKNTHTVTTSMNANVNIISQKSEHMWQEPLCVLPFEMQKPDIKHTNKTFLKAYYNTWTYI